MGVKTDNTVCKFPARENVTGNIIGEAPGISEGGFLL